MEKEHVYMTNEEYNKLNDYYNSLCLGLSKNDNFFMDNLYSFGLIASNISDLLSNINDEIKPKDDSLSFLEIFDIAREIIKNINPKYLNDFNNIMNNGVLQVNYETLDTPLDERIVGASSFSANIKDDEKYNSNKSSINIDESLNYDTIPILIHEYFHKTNYSNNKARYILSEFISIYFELYAYEYLKYKGIDSNKLSLNFRLNFLKEDSWFLMDEGFFLYTFDTLGNYNKDTYKNIPYSNITKLQLDQALHERLQEFEKMESFYKQNNETNNFNEYLAINYNEQYRYFICTLLAYYALYNLDKEKVLKLNEELINNEEITLEGALKVLGVELNDKTEKYMYISIKKYIEDNNLYQKPKTI